MCKALGLVGVGISNAALFARHFLHGPKRQKSGFSQTDLVIRSIVVSAFEVLGGLAVHFLNL